MNKNIRKKNNKTNGNVLTPVIIGIAAHQNDYRLSWAVNKALSWKLHKTDDFTLAASKNQQAKSFSAYSFDTDNLNSIQLISNRSEYGYLISEYKTIDFVLLLYGDFSESAISNILKEIKQLDIVLTAFVLEKINAKTRKVFKISV